MTYGLHITLSSNSTLVAFSNTDWVGSASDRKFTSRYCVFFGKNLISWSSKKHATIARSIIEAEYKALANATSEILWLQTLLSELGIFLSKPPILYCDNLEAIYISVNPVMHSSIKHFHIHYHFVRKRIHSKTLLISFLSSKDQVADILTKSLSTARFNML